MADHVDLEPALIHLVQKLQADRHALMLLLDSDPHDFVEQNRLLGEFQSSVRAIDILKRSITAAPNEISAAAARPTLSGVLQSATSVLAEEDRRLAESAAAMALGAT